MKQKYKKKIKFSIIESMQVNAVDIVTMVATSTNRLWTNAAGSGSNLQWEYIFLISF